MEYQQAGTEFSFKGNNSRRKFTLYTFKAIKNTGKFSTLSPYILCTGHSRLLKLAKVLFNVYSYSPLIYFDGLSLSSRQNQFLQCRHNFKYS